ncbi:MAG: AAA family ATPase [Thermoplasmata archaeon]|nr:AAA family ATPase [Thermoplasmata archaeon]
MPGAKTSRPPSNRRSRPSPGPPTAAPASAPPSTFFAIVRGPLGVGKTTVCRALADSIGAKVVSIDAIVDPEWDGGSERLFLKANVAAATLAKESLELGVPVLFDGNFYWKRQISDLESRLPFPHAVFTLAAPLSVCIERDLNRPSPHGSLAAREVFAKVVRVDAGVPINAARGLSAIVEDLLSRLPPE